MSHRANTIRRCFRVGAATLGIAFLAASGRAADVVKPEELQERERWLREHLLDVKLQPVATRPQRRPEGLIVLANHGLVQPNARGGKPLKIGDRESARGLYCHAPSRIVVRLPGPGRRFTAVAGVDSNSDTSGGRGSVVYSVTVKDQTRFQTEVMRENTPPRQVDVDLDEASEFVLDVSDAGDGISCDQADWVDAKVVLADGRELWLGEMPLVDNVQDLPARSSDLPFAFLYGGQESDGLLAGWPKRMETRKLDPQRTERTWTWTDPQTGLEVRCVAVDYADFPVVEWTVYFRNTGSAKTPILETVQALDVRQERAEGSEFVLRGIRGDSCTPDSYQPYEQTLGPNLDQRFAPSGGRPTNGNFPYYNVGTAEGGTIVAVGWPGQWATSFIRDAERSLRIAAGQQLTHLSLQPGEEIRTPLIALLFWRGGDAVRAQNVWRRWMMAHNLPRCGGQPPAPMLSFCSGGFFPGLKVSAESEQKFIDAIHQAGVHLDYWWMDAGWYPCSDWPQVGTWEPDRERFPQGLKGVSDYVHALGTKLIVWFEPERVTDGSWLATNHPDWLLGGALLNLGNADARRWLTDHVDRLLSEQGIDLYRQDFNIDPLGFWQSHDTLDRQGMTENLHVQGYLAYWDELRRRHPDMLIDSCASGGRRNDLETLRRAVPLLRSDYQSFQGDPGFAPGNQGHTYGLSSWIPFYGQGVYYGPQQFVYAVRSHMCPGFAVVMDVRQGAFDWELYRRLISQWRQVSACFLGDYYPLTPYSLSEEDWIAWQFHRAEQGEGMVQAFRRTKSGQASCVLRLRGLDPAVRYTVTDLDAGAPQTVLGQELMEQGLSVRVPEQPGAALISYCQADG